MILEGVDDVDWGRYHHAYGTAEAVPELLRAWLAHDQRDPEAVTDVPGLLFAGPDMPTVSEQALMDLWVSVFHQGDVHTAAGPLAPFLLRTVREGDQQDRADALDLLHATLAPRRELWEADGFDPGHHERPDGYAAAADVQTYLALFDGSQPSEIESRTADLLVWLPAAASGIAAVLRRRLPTVEDRDPTLAGHLVLALAMADRHCDDRSDLATFDRYRQRQEPFALLGALALARLRAVDVPGPVFTQLLEALGQPSPFEHSSYGYKDPLSGEQFSNLVADSVVNSVLHPPSGEPDAELMRATLDQLAKAYGEYGQYALRRLLAFHRYPADEDVPDRRSALKPATPGRDVDGRFHAISPSAPVQTAAAAAVGETLIGLLGLGGRRIRLVALDSLAVVGSLTIDTDPDRPPATGRIDFTHAEEFLAAMPGLVDHAPPLLRAAASPDGRWMAASSAEQCFIWDLGETAGRPWRQGPAAVLSGFPPIGVSFAWTPDSRELRTAVLTEVHVWRAGSWREPVEVIDLRQDALAWGSGIVLPFGFSGDSVPFTGAGGTTIAQVYSLDGDRDDDVLWLAPAHPERPGPGWVHTNRPEVLIVHRWREHDPPEVVEGPEREQYLDAVEGGDVIRSRLRSRSWES